VLRRILGLLVVAAAVVAIALLATGASDGDGAKRYWVELDNAFGLVDGADVKIGGVRAGKVTELKLDKQDMRALVGIEVTKTGFDDIRADVRCETRPQSLIGEYFIDCRPGTAARRLREGDTIPVEQTEATVPVDLVNDIMRRPYRERFSILLSEFGAGLAARGEDLNETIRRAVPALRQVDRLLAILRDQRRVIRDLYRDADRVMLRLADNRDDVGRFVEEARDTAAAAATEDAGIRAQWRTLPRFLAELKPTLARLQDTADAQIPALQNLNRAAPFMQRLFDTLGPYADASRPAFRTLGDAARTGRGAVSAARAPIAELRKGVDDLPEAAQNLAITLEHLDDPRFAVEKDSRAGRGPDGGYTGLEALLRYFFAQSQAINLFDANGFMLKASLFFDRDCVNYVDAKAVREQIAAGRKDLDKCRAWLGPNQPGITSEDFTKTGTSQRAARDERGGRRRRAARRGGRGGDGAPAAGGEDRGGTAGGGQGPSGGGGGAGGLVPDLDKLIDELPELPKTPAVPEVPPPPVKVNPEVPRETSRDLLDYLLGR